MKKILFAAVAALAITGCSQNEEIEKAAKTAEIGFNTVVKTTTRVTPLETDNFTAFHVYGYNIGETEVSNASAFTTPLIANGSSYTRTDKIHLGLGILIIGLHLLLISYVSLLTLLNYHHQMYILPLIMATQHFHMPLKRLVLKRIWL
ncbi:fimbrillin family protein [Bacteroides fragilis]